MKQLVARLHNISDNRRVVFYVVSAMPSARQRSCKHGYLIEGCFLCGPCCGYITGRLTVGRNIWLTLRQGMSSDLRLALAKRSNRTGVSPVNWGRKQTQFLKFSSFQNTGRWTKSENPVILSTDFLICSLYNIVNINLQRWSLNEWLIKNWKVGER
jgi:hypothetical protein